MNDLERWVAEQEMAEPMAVCSECQNNIATDGDLCEECRRAHVGDVALRYYERRLRRREPEPRFWGLALLAAFLLLLLTIYSISLDPLAAHGGSLIPVPSAQTSHSHR